MKVFDDLKSVLHFVLGFLLVVLSRFAHPLIFLCGFIVFIVYEVLEGVALGNDVAGDLTEFLLGCLSATALLFLLSL